MVSAIGSALSGLYASEQRIAVAADNIANANTVGFQAKDVSQSTDASGGVTTSVVARTPATISTPTASGDIVQTPNVSLDEEVIKADIATYSAKANLFVLKAQDKLDKYALDIQA